MHQDVKANLGDFGTFIWGYSGKNVLDVGWNFQHETFIFNRIVAIFPTLFTSWLFKAHQKKLHVHETIMSDRVILYVI